MRRVRDGQVRTVRSVTVVLDSSPLISIYLAPRYPCKRRKGRRGGLTGRIPLQSTGEHEDWLWTDNRVRMLHRPGESHGVYLSIRCY
jgi:hypothetical protein